MFIGQILCIFVPRIKSVILWFLISKNNTAMSAVKAAHSLNAGRKKRKLLLKHNNLFLGSFKDNIVNFLEMYTQPVIILCKCKI